ncbi:DUF6075 family protein [Alkaliphilus sp. B6464]|uniref:DUF6075 family protein n=1 Tax=Alkaliphilus sp. B6464 TaxID=2731219 RepID=UPI001BAA6AC7|nr:DUF6075 family protein [Alkaliphilus sp. B6464]QUH20390.1 hypothetical protein HYG84_11110 [Alkaliphilus sp. B6464]
MKFSSRKHASNFNELIKEDNTHPKDRERQALFYIVAGNDDLYKKRNAIYDFRENSIEPECLTNGKIDFSTSSKALIRLGFNLYNGYNDNAISPIDIFYSLDKENYNLAMCAVDLRFGKDIVRMEYDSEFKHEEELENDEDELEL